MAFPPEDINALNTTQHDATLGIPSDQLWDLKIFVIGRGESRGPVIRFSSGYMGGNVDVRWVKRMMYAWMAPWACVSSAPVPTTHMSVLFCIYPTKSCLSAGRQRCGGGGLGVDVHSAHDLAPKWGRSQRKKKTRLKNIMWRFHWKMKDNNYVHIPDCVRLLRLSNLSFGSAVLLRFYSACLFHSKVIY